MRKYVFRENVLSSVASCEATSIFDDGGTAAFMALFRHIYLFASFIHYLLSLVGL